ncbi:hypothetical protein BN1723_006547 [Verticillium longisporum]|uniref:WSC domain-containing protein n=2 Tax=Verticillium TaxID=1036719 RepID=A0A0G4KKG6_VERLO|nr:WSC domain-containing protein 1 like [Verticillium longisporum]CRK06865.1 hypothetical protein BN1708_009738 [Verticillium longisporum]CRK45320.1 hypothetical protein BN1723_006547 [Verticillium longisporum]
MKFSQVAWACLAAATSVQSQEAPVQVKPYPQGAPLLDNQVYQGCFSSRGELQKIYSDRNVSNGACAGACKAKYNVYAMNGATCYCGNTYPAAKDLVDQDKCNYNCPGYPYDACGGIKDGTFYDVFNSGLDVVVENFVPTVTSTSSIPAATTTEVSNTPSTTAGQDAVTTASSAPVETDSGESGNGGPSIGGIIAGVVVGVVAMAAIAGAIFWWVRRKRNSEIEEEHRRNAAVNSFIAGAKPPSSSGGISMTDSRMDPGFAHRRMSDGSIADNQDYSRKILRVTNA